MYKACNFIAPSPDIDPSVFINPPHALCTLSNTEDPPHGEIAVGNIAKMVNTITDYLLHFFLFLRETFFPLLTRFCSFWPRDFYPPLSATDPCMTDVRPLEVPDARAVPGARGLVHLRLEVVEAELGGVLQLELNRKVLK